MKRLIYSRSTDTEAKMSRYNGYLNETRNDSSHLVAKFECTLLQGAMKAGALFVAVGEKRILPKNGGYLPQTLDRSSTSTLA